MSGARTIEIFLPDGEPTGIKVAHIRNRNIEATYIPRARLNDLKARDSVQGVGIYLLVGESEERAKPRVYIGEAEIVFTRLQQHNASKDFWNYAVTLTSNSKHLTKTHVKFLEWLCHSKATLANRCILDNGNIPTKPYAPESTEADLYDNFESIDLLISTLGLKIFKPLTVIKQPELAAVNQSRPESNIEMLFKIKSKGVEAAGRYTQEGFVTLAGASCVKPKEEYKYWYPKVWDQLIADGIMKEQSGKYILMQDFLFSSPSAASTVVLGRNSNGWTEWKLPDGRTLHDVYRKAAA